MLRLIFNLTILSVLLAAPVGCNNNATPTLRLAHLSWPGYEALSLAKHYNLYENVNVSFYRPENIDQTTLAFNNGLVDVIALTLINAIELQKNSPEPILIIAVLDVSHGGDVIIANKNIKSIADLKGKRIGLEPSAFSAFFISRALESFPEITFKQLHLVPINIENHYNSFTNNTIDAIATYEPMKSKILNKDGHILFDSTKIPNQIIDVLMTHASYAKEHPEELRGLLNGYFKALELLNNSPAKAIKVMAKLEGIDDEIFKQSLTGLHIPDREENIEFLHGENSKMKKITHKLYEFLKDKNIIEQSVSPLPLSSEQFLLKK